MTYPDNATIREEFVKCRRLECECSEGKGVHGPYLYAYWKEKGKLKKLYIGKSLDDYWDRTAKLNAAGPSGGLGSRRQTITYLRRMEFLEAEAGKGNDLAREYLRKYEKEEGNISLEWAFRAVKENIKEIIASHVVSKARKARF